MGQNYLTRNDAIDTIPLVVFVVEPLLPHLKLCQELFKFDRGVVIGQRLWKRSCSTD